MLLFGILSILCMLTATSHCLSCIECMSTNSTSCDGDLVTCPDNYVCATSYTESTAGGSLSMGFIRSCAPQSVCSKNGSITSLDGNTKMSTSCCETDNCTATIQTVPPVDSTPNGVICSSCLSSSSGWCYSEQTLACTGEETVCVMQSTNISGSLLSSIRGCARPSLCGTQKYNVSGTEITYQSNCYCGGNSSNTYCSDTGVTCPTGTICARVHTKTTLGDAGDIISEINESACIPIYQCGIPGSGAFSNGTHNGIIRLMTICSTNNCNLPEPAWPTRNMTLNGVTCPTCMSQNNEWCSAEATIQCVGGETVCLVHTAKLSGTPIVIRGCSSKQYCNLGHLSHSANGQAFQYKYICPTEGYSVSCTECMDSTYCTGNNETCPSGFVCATSYTESTVAGGSNATEFIRSCAPPSQCDATGSISIINSSIKMSTSCCAFDNCSSSVLPVPSTSSEPNGVTCSTCQSSSSGWCYSEETIQCTGKETACVLQSTSIDGIVSSVRGCALQSACNYQKYSVGGTRIVYQPNCYCGGNSSSSSYCPDTNVTCPSGTVCAKVHALTTVGNTSFEVYNNTCIPVNQCGIPGTASFPNGTVKLVTICSNDNCNLPDPVLTTPAPSYNGVTCPACVSEGSEWCTADQTMPCVGNETVCLIHTAKRSGTPMIFRGCGTKTNAIISDLTYSANGSVVDSKFITPSGGYSLSCNECVNSTYCTGDSVTCPSGYMCGTEYTDSNTGGSRAETYIRSCRPLSQCDKTTSIRTLYGRTNMSTSCCAFDNCSSSILPVPPVSSEPNGVTCPTCLSFSSGWCYDEQTVQCTGEETICALHSTNINGNTFAVRGCSQQSICGIQQYSVQGIDVTHQSNCYCGGNISNTFCPDTNVTCPSGTICTTVHALTTMGDASFERRTSTCLPIHQCGVTGSTSFLKGTMKLVTVCSTNSCNLPEPGFADDNSISNCRTCPSCMRADSKCDSSETMQCTGDETLCFLQTSDLTGAATAKTAIRGCVTRNICSLGTQTYSAMGINSVVNYVCSGGAPLPTSFITLFIMCVSTLMFLL